MNSSGVAELGLVLFVLYIIYLIHSIIWSSLKYYAIREKYVSLYELHKLGELLKVRKLSYADLEKLGNELSAKTNKNDITYIDKKYEEEIIQAKVKTLAK